MAGTTAFVVVLVGGIALGIVHVLARAKVEMAKIRNRKG